MSFFPAFLLRRRTSSTIAVITATTPTAMATYAGTGSPRSPPRPSTESDAPGWSAAGASATDTVSGNSLVLLCPSESSYVTLSVAFSSPAADGVKA